MIFISQSLDTMAEQNVSYMPEMLFSTTASKATGGNNQYIQYNSLELETGDLFSIGLPSGVETMRVTNKVIRSNSTSLQAENDHTKLHLSQTSTPTGWIIINNHLYNIKWDNFRKTPFIEASSFEGLSCQQEHIDEVYSQLHKNHEENLSHLTKKSSSFNLNERTVLQSLDSVTIDLMIVYTEPAEQWVKSCLTIGPLSDAGCTGSRDIATYFDDAVALSQAALDNSNIPINLNLVHTYKTNYDETSDNVDGSGERLRRFTASPSFNPWGVGSFMNEIHIERAKYGADMVTGFFDLDDVGGIGWVLSSPGGAKQYAFTLNRIQQITNTYTLIHELGHNMGNAHSRNQSQAAASDQGGLFEFSTGYRNSFGVSDSGFTTVMGYSQGYTEIPYFSSPGLEYSGEAIGGYGVTYGPSDAALNNRLVMSAISSYQPTKVSSPVLDVQESITSSVGINESFVFTIPIKNSGESILNGNIGVYIDESVEQNIYESPSSLPIEVIIKDDFENYPQDVYKVRDNWRSTSENYRFEISSQNPSSGSQNLRLPSPKGGSHWIKSPYYGSQTPGRFTLSMDIYSTPDTSSQTNDNELHVYVYSNYNNDLSSGFIIQNESLSIITKGAEGNVFQGDYSFPLNQYNRVEVVYDTEVNSLRYYLNEREISSVKLLSPQPTMDYFYLYHASNASNEAIYDIDNLSITKGRAHRWLNIEEEAFSIAPNETNNLNITLSTQELVDDFYRGKLYLNTNDPSALTTLIPISLNVNTSVSNEESPFVENFDLLPAYPNPFNPETTLSFELPEASVVTLEVFDVLGRRVQTLANEPFAAGTHAITLDASSLSSGLYLVRMQAGNFVASQQVSLIK
jgi:hypothetical protein